MNTKNRLQILILLLSISVFSQENGSKTTISTLEPKITYLDSIKTTFVKDEMASCVDSLWMKDLTNLDLYNNLESDIATINTDEKVDFELPTELLKTRLAEMDAKSPFRIEYNTGLENIIKSFLKNRKKSFERLMSISEYYFPMFEEAFAKLNIPLEIKYLAVVESALNPKAVSRAGATGLWQFMYQTGKQYNLNIDSYVDERSDPLKSSEAAANYMNKMYSIFGDWDLVLASYNSGPGNVAKAIRRSGGLQNYWNIRKKLPRETQSYVPAFLATMYIYEYHKEHGIVPDRALIKHFATDTVMVKKQMSFKQISDLLNIPIVQLQLLNPSYKMNVIPNYQNQAHYLRLPQDKIAVFTSNEDKIYTYVQHELNNRENPFQVNKTVATNDSISYSTKKILVTKTKNYKVKRGDNLSEIADKYNVSVVELKKWNKIKNNVAPRGKNLKIVTTESVVKKVKNTFVSERIISEPKVVIQEKPKTIIKEEKTIKITTKPDTLPAKQEDGYVVQKEDNLVTIANNFNVTVSDIKRWNNLSNMNVRVGQTLKISNAGNIENAVSFEQKSTEYVVQKGDNLYTISKKFGKTIDDLKQWNNLTDNAISLGSKIIVAKNEVEKATANPIDKFKKSTPMAIGTKLKNDYKLYYVKKGDSLFSIAKKSGVTISDLKKWNDIRDEGIKPGMKLKING